MEFLHLFTECKKGQSGVSLSPNVLLRSQKLGNCHNKILIRKHFAPSRCPNKKPGKGYESGDPIRNSVIDRDCFGAPRSVSRPPKRRASSRRK